MYHTYKTLLVSAALAVGLFSCIDHRLGGPSSPARLRLRTVQGGSVNTTYTYDGQNRITSQTNGAGALYTYTYDDAQRQSTLIRQFPNPANQGSGTLIRLPYTIDGSNFQARSFTINPLAPIEAYTLINIDYYVFDANRRIAGLSNARQPTGAGTLTDNSYTFTGENITREVVVAGRSTTTYTYEYDNRINPFYGSLDPDISAVQRFSRNNVTRLVVTDTNGGVFATAEYTYEYNQQGLPTRQLSRQTGSVLLTYTYESY